MACEGLMYRESVGQRVGYIVRGGLRYWFPECADPGKCAGGIKIKLSNGHRGQANNVCTETSKYYWPQNAQSDRCMSNFGPGYNDGVDNAAYEFSVASHCKMPSEKYKAQDCVCNADGSIGDGSPAAKWKCEGAIYRKLSDSHGYVIRHGK